MTLTEATTLKDEYIKILVGKPYDGLRPDWSIEDIIVSDKENAEAVYAKMHEDNLNNEKALVFFMIKKDNYDAFIIAHKSPWGSGDILIERVQNYLTSNTI